MGGPRDLAEAHFLAVSSGDLEIARECIHPEHVNHMAADEPPACALRGPAGLMATSAWLRLAFEFRYEIIEQVSDAGRTIAHVWMRGRQTGPFVVFPPGGKPVAFAPTGRSFAVRQCHIFRMHEGLHAEHIAVRDDLGMLGQLGHLPPGPAAAARMLAFAVSGKAKAAVAAAIRVSHDAAELPDAYAYLASSA